MSDVKNDRITHLLHDAKSEHIDDEIVIAKTRSALAQHQAIIARFITFLQDMAHFMRGKELCFLDIDSTLDGEMPQHQLAALAMAIYFSNMSAQETADLTEEMMLSGEVIDLSHIAKPKIDKYSTGGVGDKTSLVLVPLAMASGVVVPMMCGVEHDYIINTLEKLAGFTRSR